MGRLPLVFLLLALAALPASATAQQSIAPPGNSGVDEYLETIPGAGGNSASTPGVGPAGSELAPEVQEQLVAQGADGKAALAAATESNRSPARGQADLPKEEVERDESGGGPGLPSAIIRTTTGSDSGGMGWWLPVILVASALGAAALAVARRRSAAS